jgi:hypothetical protein
VILEPCDEIKNNGTELPNGVLFQHYLLCTLRSVPIKRLVLLFHGSTQHSHCFSTQQVLVLCFLQASTMCQQDQRHQSKSDLNDSEADLFSLFEFSRVKQDDYIIAYERIVFAKRRYSYADNTSRRSLRHPWLRHPPTTEYCEEDEEQDTMFTMFSWSRARMQDETKIFKARTSFAEASEIRFTEKRLAPVYITEFYAIEEFVFPIVPLMAYAVPTFRTGQRHP